MREDPIWGTWSLVGKAQPLWRRRPGVWAGAPSRTPRNCLHPILGAGSRDAPGGLVLEPAARGTRLSRAGGQRGSRPAGCAHPSKLIITLSVSSPLPAPLRSFTPRRDKAGGYGIQALGGMLVEYVRGDFLNVVGFPLNRFCKELALLYHVPRAPGAPRRIHYDSIPAVDTFEDLSDAEGGGSDPAPANGGLEVGGAQPRAPRTQDTLDLNGLRDSQPPLPAGLLGLMDGFRASKVPLGVRDHVTPSTGGASDPRHPSHTPNPSPGDQTSEVRVSQGWAPCRGSRGGSSPPRPASGGSRPPSLGWWPPPSRLRLRLHVSPLFCLIRTVPLGLGPPPSRRASSQTFTPSRL